MTFIELKVFLAPRVSRPVGLNQMVSRSHSKGAIFWRSSGARALSQAVIPQLADLLFLFLSRK